MKHVFAGAIAMALFASSATGAGEEQSVAAAKDAAMAWLALADAGQYQQSWQQASSSFRSSITSSHWQSALQAARLPLGALKARRVKSATYTRSLPGAPDGEYVVIQYDSSFEHKAAAVETVTPSRERDGSWRVAGYFIK